MRLLEKEISSPHDEPNQTVPFVAFHVASFVGEKGRLINERTWELITVKTDLELSTVATICEFFLKWFHV